MRERFEPQMQIGQTPIRDIYINPKSKNSLDQLIAALKAIYCEESYRDKIFSIIENHLPDTDRHNGRPGMNLWTIFVLAQVRLCLNESYDMLHNLSNNHLLLRKLLGISELFPVEFEYQNIYDNVSKLSDSMLSEINAVIVEFGHKKVFKKKETTALQLKTDSFVVESNVHFPTDYNLLWDCCRKLLDTIDFFKQKYPSFSGWRKLKNWQFELKSHMRALGKISGSGGKNKQENLRKATESYLTKSRLLVQKYLSCKENIPLNDIADLEKHYELEKYINLLKKHIDLVDRRILKGENIPHDEKMWSIFETYTEWIVKGKTRPPVELGKKLCITTDQYNLIVHHKVMNKEQDRDVVVEVADAVLSKYKKIESMSFDKGYYNKQFKEVKELLELEIPNLILPKMGKRTVEEKEVEESKIFKCLKNRHSAIESNINELEHRGLDRCPDRTYKHFKTYIALAVGAYNLKKIGKQLLANKLSEMPGKKVA